MMYVIWLIIYKSVTQQTDTVPPIKIWPDNGYEILQIIPIICFAYQVFEFSIYHLSYVTCNIPLIYSRFLISFKNISFNI